LIIKRKGISHNHLCSALAAECFITVNNGKEIERSVLMKEIKAKMDNPLSELISDNIYDLLNSNGLIDDKSVRDFQMRMQYKQLRASKVRASDAIDAIKQKYAYLQYDTIRKIVYQVGPQALKENNKS
jgi:hypothetical protein